MRAATIRPSCFLTSSVIRSSEPGRSAKNRQVPLSLSLADLQAVLQVAVVVLVGLGVDDHGVIDPGLGHAPQQVLGGGGLGGLVGSLRVVGEPRIVLAGEAMQMGIDHGGTPVGGFEPGDGPIRNGTAAVWRNWRRCTAASSRP